MGSNTDPSWVSNDTYVYIVFKQQYAKKSSKSPSPQKTKQNKNKNKTKTKTNPKHNITGGGAINDIHAKLILNKDLAKPCCVQNCKMIWQPDADISLTD